MAIEILTHQPHNSPSTGLSDDHLAALALQTLSTWLQVLIRERLQSAPPTSLSTFNSLDAATQLDLMFSFVNTTPTMIIGLARGTSEGQAIPAFTLHTSSDSLHDLRMSMEEQLWTGVSLAIGIRVRGSSLAPEDPYLILVVGENVSSETLEQRIIIHEVEFGRHSAVAFREKSTGSSISSCQNQVITEINLPLGRAFQSNSMDATLGTPFKCHMAWWQFTSCLFSLRTFFLKGINLPLNKSNFYNAI